MQKTVMRCCHNLLRGHTDKSPVHAPLAPRSSITLDAAAGELVCFVSRNGAGKTTTFRNNMGFLKPVSGTLQFVRQPLTGMDTHRIACVRIHDPQLLLLDEPFETFVARDHSRHQQRDRIDSQTRPRRPDDRLGCA